MKSLKKIIFVLTIILIAGMQLLYILFVNRQMRGKIEANEEEIFSVNRQIQGLEQKLKVLPQTKEAIKKAEQQKVAVINTIPLAQSVTQSAAELFSIARANSFFDVVLENGEDTIFQDELGIIIEKNFTLEYVSTFRQAEQFVESLNVSNQMINIKELSVDNGVQKGDKAKILSLWYGEQMNQVVTTKVSFSIFARKSDKISDEIYEPIFNLSHNVNEIFLNREKEEEEEKNSVPVSLPEPVPTERQSTEKENINSPAGTFRLDVSDELTSGDTYKFLGPGSGQNSYTGLVSSVNTHITINVENSGYEITMEDEAGNIKQNSVQMNIEHPSLTIFSQMRNLKESMPQVYVYIHNYTDEAMDVTLKGSLLENIHIYNEFDEEIQKGQSKGKVYIT